MWLCGFVCGGLGNWIVRENVSFLESREGGSGADGGAGGDGEFDGRGTDGE